MTNDIGSARSSPTDEETRRGYTLWFQGEFKKMLENGIDDGLWDDVMAEQKAKTAVEVVLRNITNIDPPTVYVRVRNSIVSISVLWLDSQERH